DPGRGRRRKESRRGTQEARRFRLWRRVTRNDPDQGVGAGGPEPAGGVPGCGDVPCDSLSPSRVLTLPNMRLGGILLGTIPPGNLLASSVVFITVGSGGAMVAAIRLTSCAGLGAAFWTRRFSGISPGLKSG